LKEVEIVEERSEFGSWTEFATVDGAETLYPIEQEDDSQDPDLYAVDIYGEGVRVSRLIVNTSGTGPEFYKYPIINRNSAEVHYFAPEGYIKDDGSPTAYLPVHKVFQREVLVGRSENGGDYLSGLDPVECILDTVGTDVYPDSSKVASFKPPETRPH
jgi:hypothetical protein